MAANFLSLTFTPGVLAAQQRYFGRSQNHSPTAREDILTPEETSFIAARDHFYLSSVSETGWPYVQHRGGARGFLKIIGPNQLAFADYKGNRQLLTTGNVAADDRVCLFLMDYVHRDRLKILGHAEVLDARTNPDLVANLTAPELAPTVERIIQIRVVAFDWNCSKYITPRYTSAEIEEAIAPLQRRVAELEAQLQKARPPNDP
jgi:predicted pyridoxine 5'-phosphate oxidase superfamily flavin-nucleotide-binding protein